MYMSNSAPLHDFSIQLSLLKAPGVEPDSQGLARVELAAVAKGLPQKPVRRREDTSEDTSTELFQPVKLSIYASTDHQLGVIPPKKRLISKLNLTPRMELWPPVPTI